MIGTQTPTAELMTAEQLLAYHAPNQRVELVRGRLMVCEPPGWQHGEVTVRVAMAIGNHLVEEQHRNGWASARGRLAAGDPGFTLSRAPDTVRAPDVAYVSRERHSAPLPWGFPELAPDLAVEVRSPTDRAGNMQATVADWLEAGCLLVWVIDPERETVTVYRADGTVSVFGSHDTLTGEDVLPGFACEVRALVDRN